MLMMGTVVIFFFACLLPFKVLDIGGGGGGDGDGHDDDGVCYFIFEGVDHVGCDLSI